MDLDEAFDIVEELQSTLSGPGLLAALRSHADALQPGEEGRACFLAVLGEFQEMADDFDSARATYREALADGGPAWIDPRCGLLTVELRSDNPAEAVVLLAELTAMARAHELSDDDFEYIGESLEEHGRYREAMRWFTIPLRDTDPDDLDALPIVAIHSRFRVRRALELPMDRYDVASEQVTELHRARFEAEGV